MFLQPMIKVHKIKEIRSKTQKINSFINFKYHFLYYLCIILCIVYKVSLNITFVFNTDYQFKMYPFVYYTMTH